MVPCGGRAETGNKEDGDGKRFLGRHAARDCMAGSWVLMCCASAGGVDALLPFLSGGMLGLLYQLSVQSAVDSLPLPMKQSFEESPMDRSNVVVCYRLGSCCLANHSHLRNASMQDGFHENTHDPRRTSSHLQSATGSAGHPLAS